MTDFKKMSKRQQKEFLKEHRKPPMPPCRVSESNAQRKAKANKIAKQKLRNEYKT